MPASVRFLILASALAVAACATPAPAAPSAPTAAAAQVPTTVASTPTPTPTPPAPSPLPSAAEPTPTPAYRLLGLGDSVAGAGHCGGCRSYVTVFGDLAATALADTVATTNLGSNNDLGSGGLLAMVTKEEGTREEIARSDLITIDIGWNDWQGPCFGEGLAGCLERGQARAEPNVDATLAEISKLRAGRPTVVRVVTYADPYVGDPQTAAIFEIKNTPKDVAALEHAFTHGLRDFNAMLCRVAAAHAAACVDLVPAFNGPDGTTTVPQALRESQAQMDVIAREIDKVGYAPLR